MKVIFKRFKSILTAFVVAFVGLLCAVAPATYNASAEASSSSVLDDLRLDKNFNESDYPSLAGDYSLDVIQIAESTDGELLIYVYQPAAGKHKTTASSINISIAIDGAEDYNNYKLRFLNSDGVFFKYAVEGLTLRQDVLRFYSITAIYRPYDGDIDSTPNDDNTIEEKAYAVGQLWTATTYEDTVLYSCRYLDLITIEEKHIGFIRYSEGGIFFSNNTDSHYVAFSTDRKIDDLLEVEMQYKKQAKTSLTIVNTLTGKTTVSTNNNGDLETVKLTLTDDDVFEGGYGLFSEVYKYNRIQTKDEFLRNETVSLDTQEALEGTEWVLRFAETDYTVKHLQTTTYTQEHMTYHTTVTGVVLFRMEFIYDGVVYNMGVVDNISHGDTTPDNKYWDPSISGDWSEWFGEFDSFGNAFAWWQWLIIALVAIAVIVLVVVFIKPITSLIIWLCKGLWWLICAPFRFIRWIVRKIRGDYD